MSDQQHKYIAPAGNPSLTKRHDQLQSLPPGTVVPSAQYPGARSIVLEETSRPQDARLVDEKHTRDWEYVTVARPIDLLEKVYEIPTTRTVQTLIPKVQVREIVKTIEKEVPQYVEKHVEILHQKIVDKYVEVPVLSGTEVKYIPKVEVRERTIRTTKPEIKWLEKYIEVPQIKEVVRYVESDKNVETVIRYVPKGSGEITVVEHEPAHLEEYPQISGTPPGVNTPKGLVSLAQTAGKPVSAGNMQEAAEEEVEQEQSQPKAAGADSDTE